MKRIALLLALFVLGVAPAAAQQGAFQPWKQPGGAFVSGQVLLCDSGVDRVALPCGGATTPMTVLATPFSFSNGGDPIIFDGITTTPKQFRVDKPASATSYRIINPCNVDIRARRVESLTQQVTATTGARVMARSAETFGTSSPGFVSIMAVAAPSADCALELNYGNGG